MKNSLFCGLFLFSSALFVSAQTVPMQNGPVNGAQASTDARAKATVTPLPKADPTPEKTSPTSSATYVRPSAKKRFHSYLNGMFGPMTLGKSAAYAGIGTWRNSPEEWGDHWDGFGRRVASGLGTNAIKQTITYGLGEAGKLDSSYYRSKKKDFGSRVKNAVISPVTARDPEGKRVFGYPRIVGIYTANLIARETWYPARYDWKDGMKSATLSLGMSVGYNLIKEFIWK
jgi:hypothetical protein